MKLRVLILSGAFAALAACSGQSADEAAEEPAAAAEAAPETTAAAALPRSESPADARVFFITPADGASVSNPVRIEFGIDGMDIVPAGTRQANSGHHHLLIDTGLPDMGLPIPADDRHVHFGDGSTATEITLEPGVHSLQMLLGDYLHIPHDPPVLSEPITITVE